MEATEQAKVLKFPEQPAVFTAEMKKKLSSGIATKTDKPDEVVEEIEKIICRHIITIARNIGNKIGEKIANFITGSADNVFEKRAK